MLNVVQIIMKSLLLYLAIVPIVFGHNNPLSEPNTLFQQGGAQQDYHVHQVNKHEGIAATQYQGQHVQMQGRQDASGNQGVNLIRDKSHIQDKEHIKEHLDGVVDQPDLSQMSEEELQFHYFKIHDSDGNNKLDGCELIKSLIHWHMEENQNAAAKANKGKEMPKIFSDSELSVMIDPILDMDDQNKDGYIDYPEFVAAQQSRGF